MFFRRPSPRPAVHAKSQRVGLDVTASRLRAVVAGTGDRPVMLDTGDVDLRAVLALDRAPPGVGRCGSALIKKSPHLTAVNTLGALGSDRQWKIGKRTLSAEGAVGTIMAKAAEALASEAEAVVMTVPAWMSLPQVTALTSAATTHKLPVVGTIASSLALAVDRAGTILHCEHDVADERPADIVRIRPTAEGPGSAVVIDADDHALSASVIWVDRDGLRLLSTAAWPKLNSRLWLDRLIDFASDRCVRLCRRDPRDSADAEQSLYEQLSTHGTDQRSASLHLRAAHWVQDLTFQPGDFETATQPFVNQTISNLTDLIYASGVPAPPRAMWLTAAAARLPGLRASIHDHSAESTTVAALPPDAVAAAAAKLTTKWLSNEWPRQHLDVVIPTRSNNPAALPANERVRIG